MNLCGVCGGIVGPWLEYQVDDPEAFACACDRARAQAAVLTLMLRTRALLASVALGLVLAGCGASLRDAEGVLLYRTSVEAENECNRRGVSWARQTWQVWLASAGRPMPWPADSACFNQSDRTTIRREGAPSSLIEHENTHAHEGDFHR